MNRGNAERPHSTTVNWPVLASDAGVRLDKFLAAPARLGSRAKAFAAIQRRKVFIGDREAVVEDAGRPVSEGDVVRLWMDRPGSASAKRVPAAAGDLDIVFEDESMIVVNKPAGLLSVPLERKGGAASVFDLIETYLRPLGKRRPLVVHRIDQDTSGLVVFARDARAQSALKAQFKRREPARIYLAVVYGHPQPSAGTWRDRLVWDTRALIQKATHPRDPAGTDAISQYEVRERYRDASLVEVRLVTGRRNQIRLQARLRGHPLVGETRYTHGPAAERTIPFERHALHAWRLACRHPVTGAAMEFEAPLPRDLAALLVRLRRSRATHP